MPITQDNTTDNKDDILKILDKVIDTGTPMTVKRRGKQLIISPVPAYSKLENLDEHPKFINGDPESIVHMDWSNKWKYNP